MSSHYSGAGAWENSPLECHKQYMEDERPRWPSLRDLYDAWFENPDNWDEQHSVDVTTYLEDPVVVIAEEWEGTDPTTEPETFDFIDGSGCRFPLYWWQRLKERQAEWLIKDAESKLIYYSEKYDRVMDLAPSFRSYLTQYNPFYKLEQKGIKSAAKE